MTVLQWFCSNYISKKFLEFTVVYNIVVLTIQPATTTSIIHALKHFYFGCSVWKKERIIKIEKFFHFSLCVKRCEFIVVRNHIIIGVIYFNWFSWIVWVYEKNLHRHFEWNHCTFFCYFSSTKKNSLNRVWVEFVASQIKNSVISFISLNERSQNNKTVQFDRCQSDK